MQEKIYAKINTLEKMAKEYYTKGIPDEEIAEQDITTIFLDEIPFIIENEVLSIGIIGKTKSSKSSLMMLLLKYFLNNYYNQKIELWNICAEQYEFGRKIMDEEIHDTILGIDEFGALEETGYNATIEQKYLEQFSDLQAQRNIGRIMCAPRKIFDINANIIIKIISKDTARFLTHTNIYYKIETPNYTHTQLIGRATFNLQKIIIEKDGWKQLKKDYKKDWEKYKKLTKNPTTEHQEEYGKNNEEGFWKYIIKKHKLKEFGKEGFSKYQNPIYSRYRLRKWKKFSLLNKEGIFQMREMEFSELYLVLFKKLLPISKATKVTKDMIEGKAFGELKKRRLPATIFTIEILKTKVNSLISQHRTLQEMKIKLIKVRDQKTRKDFQEAINETTQSLQEEIDSLQNLVRVSREYNEI